MLDDDVSVWLFTITDLKQYTYCARVFYYQVCLPHIRPITYKMQAGMEAHAQEPKRALRRSFEPYGAHEGRRLFDVVVQSKALGFTGFVDEVVETDTTLTPVDYKLARKVGYNHKIQLTAYALMLEEAYDKAVQHGFVYLIPYRKAVEVAITPKLRRQVKRMAREMRTIAESERMPPPTDWRQRCADCEFRRFCNDV